jgi:hypothetical protein
MTRAPTGSHPLRLLVLRAADRRYQYSSSWHVLTAHFGFVIQHLTGEKDFKKFLVDAKQEYRAAF